MNTPYSLYDALASINVPTEKVRAVVDAMEHDMTTLLATKSDLSATQSLLKQDIDNVQSSLKKDIDNVQSSLKQDIDNVHASLRQELAATRDLLQRDMELLRSSMTIRLGTMQFVSMGLLFAALKLN